MQKIKDTIILWILVKNAIKIYKAVAMHGVLGALSLYTQYYVQVIIGFARRRIPGVEAKVKLEIQKTVESIERSVAPEIDAPVNRKLPEVGHSVTSIKEELKTYQDLDHCSWESGKVSGTVYHGGKELSLLLKDAYGMFSVSNPLHPDVFPGVRKMEAEVISMCLDLYHGGCGSLTSGGTESILMSIKAHRDMYADLKGITEPEMVVPVSAHAAFNKGAHYFGVKLVSVPVDLETGKVIISKVASAINSNTILIVGSSPSFPHGAIDDIKELSDLAVKKNIGLHVDSCLGGFLIPFMSKAGYELNEICDFRLPGVTSISCDTHKYGFAPKGSSVIMYKTKEIRNYQYFVQTDWSGGVYGSPTMAGSRPGAISVGCWAAMMRMGLSGYVDSTRKIITAARTLKAGILMIPELKLIGDPLLSVIAFQGTTVKTYAVADLLTKRGWLLNILQFPPAIHMAMTLPSVQSVGELLSDIQEVVDILKKDPSAGNGETAAIYGTAASVPDRSIIKQVTYGFLDALTK